jgi:hypothetical protein
MTINLFAARTVAAAGLDQRLLFYSAVGLPANGFLFLTGKKER